MTGTVLQAAVTEANSATSVSSKSVSDASTSSINGINSAAPLGRLELLVNALGKSRVVRRTGQVVTFDHQKIDAALTAAFIAKTGDDDLASHAANIAEVTCRVLERLLHEKGQGSLLAIEGIQDQVELALMREGHYEISVAYSHYREQHAQKRRKRAQTLIPQQFNIKMKDGSTRTIDPSVIYSRLEVACQGLNEKVCCDQLASRVVASLHDGIEEDSLDKTLVLESSTMVEKHPDYSFVAARLLLDQLIYEVAGKRISHGAMIDRYPSLLAEVINRGVAGKRLDPRMQTTFDLHQLGNALRGERDLQLGILGLQTLYDRYFVKVDGKRIELPQTLWMRVAMGLALNEDNPTERAIEFYEVLSTFRFMNSTPTLFNAGTTFPQLSSCYLSTVEDELSSIYGAITDNAMLAKFSGGLGNDWTPVRALGSRIKSTDGKSQGVVPFLRVVNDTAIAVNQGGKRKGAVCCYLETWHADVKEFLNLRKSTGDERRRTHDMNTANWVPDLFMQRVREKSHWTLFSPSDVPDLHDLYGIEFAEAYVAYEAKFDAGEIPGSRENAKEMWKYMMRMLYETGHPWITFKDPCNLRSPQQHVGVVHSSNLCTEITLNTSKDEIAVCNLGSVNLPRHLRDGKLDEELLKRTIHTAMRMLDNVIDINYYSVDKARKANMRHRAVGLGQVGYQDCLYELGLSFDSDEAVEFADYSTELIAYHAYQASSELAVERGSYETFKGSLWDQGVLPHDSLQLLAKARNGGKEITATDGWLRSPDFEVNVETKLDWDSLRDKIKQDGMRNSNCLAIAPTATIGNIMGASPCIEPTYKNLFTKSNLSGEFKVINRWLVQELQDKDLWDDAIVSQIKANDGEIQTIESIPKEIRARYKTAFNINFKWFIEAASRRQKWIDQSQSLNLFIDKPSGIRLNEMYMLAWERGLKTTYYCRSMQASSTEKFTTNKTGDLNNVKLDAASATDTHLDGINNGTVDADSSAQVHPQACAIDDPDCEACQ